MKFTNIHLPVALVLLLALDHNHLEHPLLGVDLIQDLLQLQLQNGLCIQDEVMLAIWLMRFLGTHAS